MAEAAVLPELRGVKLAPLQRIYRAGAGLLYLVDTPRRHRFATAVEGALDTLSQRDYVSFLQIGAYDGKHDDPVACHIERNPSWHGVLVEPQQEPAGELRDRYSGRNDVFVRQAAVAPEGGVVTLWTPNHGGHTGAHPLASLDLPVATRSIKRLAGPSLRRDPGFRRQKVDAVSIDGLLREHSIDELDLLVSDTQGSDDYVVNGVLDTLLPAVILYEHNLLKRPVRRQLWQRLGGLGYRLARSHKDTLAVVQ